MPRRAEGGRGTTAAARDAAGARRPRPAAAPPTTPGPPAPARHAAAVETMGGLGLVDEGFTANALNPAETMDKVAKATGGKMADLCINTANVEGTELASVLACRQGGKVYFFNMATNFQKAALGAEGIGMDVEMIIGNGYAPNHADFTLDLYRKNAAVRKWFDEKFGS